MMNGTAVRFTRCTAALLGVLTLGWILTGRAATPEQQGFPTDWSHHHLIFSRPADARRAMRVEADPRYWQQFARRNIARVLSEDGYNLIERHSRHFRPTGSASTKVHRDWAVSMGSTASSGAGNFPAKYTFQTTTANCGSATTPDYVVFNTGLTGSSGQASIVAFDNLYSGCGGTVPQTYWAYNTGGQVLTSPVISLDGTQVAFVQTNVAHIGTLVLLKWAASTGTISSPTTLTAVANSAYRACTAPCMTTITLRSAAGPAVDDTTSSLFPDYSNDALYVGGTVSWLHKITGAFLGLNPKEATTGGFPLQVNPDNPNTLSSPVYDSTTGSIFVGDYGGFVYRVNSSTGAVVSSAQVDHGTGVVAGPIVDSTAGKVYVFSSNDGTTSCVGSRPCSAVYALNTGFSGGSSGTEVAVGASAASPTPLYQGDFDSTYQNSSTATGNLYVCGNTGGPPILYQVPIANGTPSTAVAGPVLANATTGCSPVTDVYNPNATGAATEWIFASVQTSGLGSSCNFLGCIMNFKDTPRLASHAYAVGQTVLDSNFQIQIVTSAGTSAAGNPTWSTTTGGSTTDGTVKWFNQGTYMASIAPWKAITSYAVGNEVVDSNGQVEQCTKAGVSNATAPTWTTGAGGNTSENGAGPHWTNLGALATTNAFTAGGTSGISLDNTVASGTLAGASQIYFSTLSDQNCATSGGTGGCAVQASQSALQ